MEQCRRSGAIAWIGLTLAGLAVAVGCRESPSATRPPSPAVESTSPAAVKPVLPARLLRSSELTDAERQYGHAPTLDSSVVYQPEVVIVEGGAKAVRALSADGLGCTIDAEAAHAAAVRPGGIVMVTGRCVGRVLAIEKQGDGLALTLGPVEITEIVREGSFQLDQPLDLDDTVLFRAPKWAGFSTQLPPLLPEAAPPAQDRFVPQARNRREHPTPVSYAMPRVGMHSPAALVRQAPDLPVSKELPFVGKRMIGSWIPVSENGVEFLGHATLHLESPRIRFVLEIRAGEVKRCELELHGAAGLTMGFKAGSEGGGNLSVLRDLPVDVTIPIAGPVPFSVLVRQSSLIKTAFTAKNSFVQDYAEYTFTGAFRLGYNNGSWGIGAPTSFKIKHSPLTSLNGASIGLTGIVLVHQVKLMVGIGAFGFATGPYTALSSSLAVTRGADAAGVAWSLPTVRGIARCKQATIVIDMAAGIGYMIPQPVTNAINAVLGALNIRHRIGSSGGLESKPLRVVGMKTWEPDLEVCKQN